ncbi:integrase catalytic domain-containing protein [Nephila pilipes]|uniref:Integrase catalytic domain-containing protein n=1 Tax=Nephila pilipes TaxID=299642 RepID=A0A8X6TSP1_NEPPI|nr:integrase catalytic domain-containing protein [Nephila pilipes]
MHSDAPVKLLDSLALVPSSFGWILSGSRSHATVSFNPTVHSINVYTLTHELDNMVRNFWNLESIGIQPIQEKLKLSTHNAELLSNFHQSFKIIDGRRVIHLPWKPEVKLTSSNYDTAIRRFNSWTRRIHANTELKQKYAKQMQDYIDKKQVEAVLKDTQNEVRLFYLPHHTVKKITNEEIKWRIVFDASSHSPGHPSLNDALEAGPNLLPDILAMLLRFRLSKIAITSDGSQAFLQLILADEDRDATRFLWYKTEYTSDGNLCIADEIVTYRFTRLPFGLTSSPFLLSASLRELATMYKQSYPIATKHIENNTYMDGFVIGTSTDTEAITLYREMLQLTSHISLPLAKWTTNSKALQGVWKQENVPFREITQVLGVEWDTDKDVFQIDVQAKIVEASKEPVTKRLLLKLMSKFYDRLGLFAPVTVIVKILFQDTWLSGIKWDELLPPAVAQQWHKWINELQCLKDIRIPRWIGFSETSDVTIHVFCDASERAYGACLYARHTVNNFTEVNLICSRSQLPPVKKITLPRLELLAALLGTRLLQYFYRETNMHSHTAVLWSDSTVALSWIKGDPNRWKTFVCNRTTEILQYTTPSQWRHCTGTDNPADHLTRGTFPSQLPSLESWGHGPKWLNHDSDAWPTKDFPSHSQPSVEVESRKIESRSFYVATTEPIIDISRYSSYTKLLRVTAWILRFVHNSEINALKEERPLQKKSKISCFNPFLTNDYLRLGGRLQFSDIPFDTQHPLILDGNHPFVHLLIQHTHIRLHHLGVRIVLSELRSTFWILRGRQAINKALLKCLPCKLFKAKCGMQIEAPLPSERVVSSAPFTITGIDFAGPVNIRCLKPRDTAYIALFTCATTRALHIELVSDLTTDKFLLALQRFVGRRGLTNTIYTDNATTFHAANKELILLWQTLSSAKTQQYYAQNGITWRFIASRVAWWGGWWERLIALTNIITGHWKLLSRP